MLVGRLYLVAALSLLALCLSAYALIWPLNGATNDEWTYLYAGQQGEWAGARVNRPWAFGGSVISHQIWGSRAQQIHAIHVMCLYGVALGLFHIAYRLRLGAGLAFSIAALGLLYAPYNRDISRAFFIQPYSWALLLAVICSVLLVEGFISGRAERGRGALIYLVASGLMAYVGARIYEGFIPLLLLLPIIFYGRLKPPLSNPFLAGMALWAAGVMAGALAFALPYLRGEDAAAYQARIQAPNSGLSAWLSGSADFYRASFPLDTLLNPSGEYVLAGLLLGGLFLIGFWALGDEVKTPPLRDGLLLMALGLILTGAGGAAFIYADLALEYRAHFYAASGQAVTLVGALLFMMNLLARSLRIPPRLTLSAAALWLGVGVMSWFGAAQDWAADFRGPSFDAKGVFFQELVALAPNIEPNTALIYHCESPTLPAHLARLADMFAVAYLYNGAGVELVTPRYDVEPLRIPQVVFDAEGLRYSHEYNLFENVTSEFYYGYAEMIVIGCTAEGIEILAQFPTELAELAPNNADLSAYNPYARLGGGFIGGDAERIVAR